MLIIASGLVKLPNKFGGLAVNVLIYLIYETFC